MNRTLRRSSVTALALILVAACASETETRPQLALPTGAVRPTSYDEFVSVTEYGSLAEAISRESYIWLPPGTWVVDNPLVISRSAPLYLHGGDRTGTQIVGRDPSLPLFEILAAPLVQISSVALKPSASRAVPNARVLLARNAEPTAIELVDVRINEGMIEMRGPGTLQLQNPLLRPMGWLTQSILVDHPDARLTLMGGDISNFKQAPQIPTDTAYHIRVRQGRLRIYGLSIEAAIGPADFRIDSASAHGPHVLSAVRSEGNNGANRGSYRSTMVEVPESSEAIDLVMKSNIGAWGSQGYGRGRLVSYRAAGTVWLLGNNVEKAATALVEGPAPHSTLVAVGNYAYDHRDLLPVPGARRFAAGNIYFHRLLERNRPDARTPSGARPPMGEKPFKRFVDPAPQLQASVPAIPDDEIPVPLDRPALRSPLEGMRSAVSFGARGDGVHDDTQALQSLLDAACADKGNLLFLPPGRYRTTAALRYNTEDTCKHGSGGWIAGAGRDLSIIERDPAKPGSVFVTRAMSAVTIQGLTFRTAPWRRDAPTPIAEPTFDLGRQEGLGLTTHFVSFYDTRFDGGKYGLGVRIGESSGNGEGNLIIHSEFRNARIGLAIGDYNVLNNNVYASDFVDNEIAMGHGEEGQHGGVWSVFGAKVSGTGHTLLSFRGASSGAWYFQGLEAEAPRIIDRRNSGGSFPLVFDRSALGAPEGRPLLFESSQDGGPIFLHSRVDRLKMTLNGQTRSLYGIRLGSEVGGWDRSVGRGPHARFYELSE